jgi:hypothetical protein
MITKSVYGIFVGLGEVPVLAGQPARPLVWRELEARVVATMDLETHLYGNFMSILPLSKLLLGILTFLGSWRLAVEHRINISAFGTWAVGLC